MNENTQKIIDLSNGRRSSAEIAAMTGLTARYVRKVMTRHNCPRLQPGSQPGKKNHQYKTGRRIDRDGYALVSVANHPFARKRPGRKMGQVFEHRLIVEDMLDRYLEPGEVVDHVDGLKLHNHPDNLRLFATNAEHLRQTVGVPEWSVSGWRKINSPRAKALPRVDIHHQRKKRGDVRLQQILLAALRFGIDSPYLLGTRQHLVNTGIDPRSHSNLKRALAALDRRYAADLAR